MRMLTCKFLEEYRDKPLFCDENDENDDNIQEILNEHTNLQARADAIPWTLGGEDVRWPSSDEFALAPSPGPGYGEYYLSIRSYTRRYHKIQRQRQAFLGGCEAQPKSFASCDEPATGTPDCQQDISPCVLAQCSSIHIEPRGKRSKDYHDRHVKRTSGTLQQPKIYRSVDCVTCSLETLVFIFHPCA
jgi:hypothetical protein